jgi:poly(3-hydroxybutyrate) depolymerase
MASLKDSELRNLVPSKVRLKDVRNLLDTIDNRDAMLLVAEGTFGRNHRGDWRSQAIALRMTRCASVLNWLGLAVLACGLFGVRAQAETIEKTGTFGGLKVTYKVDLPNGYDPAHSYPVLLVFTGGGQTMDIVDMTLADWRSVAEQRGYIVVSPAAPDGMLFFEGGDRIFPAFLDQIMKDYKPKGGKLFLAGHSNGGMSAFHVATSYPQYFLSVTGYPGLLYGDDIRKVDALKPLCIFMHAGERDPDWRDEMRRQAEEFRKRGFRVEFDVEKDQIHRLNVHTADLQNRLFAQLEQAANGCKQAN